MLPRQSKSRVRETGMNGSVLAKNNKRYGGLDSRRYGSISLDNDRYQSLDMCNG